MTDKHEALIFADDRLRSHGDDIYEWAIDAEDWIRRLHAELETLRAGYEAARLEIESLRASHGQAPAQPVVPAFTEAQIASACLSYRHDFGLLGETDRKSMMWIARQWERAFAKEREFAAPAQAAPAYKDSTPELHVGDSAFESWYSSYNPTHKGDKQRARDAYAAGMGDSLVMAAPAAVAGPVPSGWNFDVKRSDGRVWLTISTPHGASATLSAAEKTGNGDDTIVAQVLAYLADSLAAPAAVAGPSPTASFEKALSAYLTGDGFIAADDIPNICNDFAQLLAVMACAVRWAPSSAYWSDQLRMYFGEDARKGIDALEKQLRDALAAPQPLPAAPVRDYPQLPDFDTVEQHIYGACRRYITQDMLEPIHNLIRDAIDADRAARAPADSGAAPAAYSGNIEQELAMLIRRIVSSARRNCEDGSNVLKLANEAWVYLVRKGLNGSPLRDAGIESDPTPAAQAADSVLEDAGGANWQDISTAPKDGTRFVAVGNNYGLYSEMQHTCIAQWFRGCWIEASDWNETSELKYLTHWMPLLPLPGSAARKQGANHD